MQCERPKTSFSFSFYKTKAHSERSGMNYSRVQARLLINFNSNIVDPRHTTTSLLRPYSLDSNVEIRLILIFIFFEIHPLKRPPHYYKQDFIAQRWSHWRGSTVVNCFMTYSRLRIETDLHWKKANRVTMRLTSTAFCTWI